MTEPEASQTTRAADRLSGWAVSILRLGAISLALGIIFAWFGVYETTAIPFPERVAYWTLLMAVGTGAGTIVTPLVFDRWLPAAHPAVQIAVASALISVPVTAGLVMLEATDGTWTPPSWWWQQYFYVIVLSAIMTTAAWGISLLKAQKAAPPAPVATHQPAVPTTTLSSPFADRLPPKFRAAEIHAVSAEDHYLRVHTSSGETMILMRLADAVRELGALEGMQTHRSWWVARQGLAETARGDGKVTLKLKSGAEAPVSRTYQKAVRDAGWL